MEHDEAGCQAPERPILCINNCGFFGSSATMNMCSKCHKDHILKQEQVKLAASSIDCAVNGSGSSSSSNKLAVGANLDISVCAVEPPIPVVVPPTRDVLTISDTGEGNAKEGPSRCNACKKRVGLTGFNCRCGNVFCAAHRYSDKHNCQFNYRMAARDAIAKANPVVKAEKLDKI
ncbi:Zinc finger A20 and AN1 domain-containing stress-associated protein 8 [Platanthera zijinensis]|uniref:Zinc finger A20 and AN1 domain-containing stress-associated protein 8 n=1 Tax=Platanthera zijinensis TaxID=2320716 RepID=A0AAP0B4H7_9ASPA